MLALLSRRSTRLMPQSTRDCSRERRHGHSAIRCPRRTRAAIVRFMDELEAKTGDRRRIAEPEARRSLTPSCRRAARSGPLGLRFTSRFPAPRQSDRSPNRLAPTNETSSIQFERVQADWRRVATVPPRRYPLRELRADIYDRSRPPTDQTATTSTESHPPSSPTIESKTCHRRESKIFRRCGSR